MGGSLRGCERCWIHLRTRFTGQRRERGCSSDTSTMEIFYLVHLTSTAEPQEGVKIMLDCAQATMISYDKLVISLKGGEL